MAPIEFYYIPESSPCRAVEMVAEIVGVTLNKHYVNLIEKEHLKDEHIRINPLHKVPFIIDGDLKITESRAIMIYLVNKYKPGDTSLYPKDPVERARVDELLFFDIGSLYSSAYKLCIPIFFRKSTTFDEEDKKVFEEKLAYLDDRLESTGKKFLLGDNYTLADISIVATLTIPQACDVDMSKFKNLMAYWDRLKVSIPKYDEINEKAVASIRESMKANQPGK